METVASIRGESRATALARSRPFRTFSRPLSRGQPGNSNGDCPTVKPCQSQTAVDIDYGALDFGPPNRAEFAASGNYGASRKKVRLLTGIIVATMVDVSREPTEKTGVSQELGDVAENDPPK